MTAASPPAAADFPSRVGPMRNRVTPLGDIVAISLRGAWLGNRGVLHDGTTIVRNYRNLGWVTCALSYRDWRLPQWAPGRMTLLFFHDEAVALAAGHRPCALCRRPAYTAFRDAWADGIGAGQVPRAGELDRRLHDDRIDRSTRTPRRHLRPWADLPDGTFVVVDDAAALVLGDALVPWTSHGYGPARGRPRSGEAVVATPSSTVTALAAGYRPQIDTAATAAVGAPDVPGSAS